MALIRLPIHINLLTTAAIINNRNAFGPTPIGAAVFHNQRDLPGSLFLGIFQSERISCFDKRRSL